MHRDRHEEILPSAQVSGGRTMAKSAWFALAFLRRMWLCWFTPNARKGLT